VAHPRPLVALLSAASCSHLDADLPLLVPALAALGVRAEVADWHDPATTAEAQLVVVRSTWDYTDHVAAFHEALAELDRRTTLLNPWPVMAANLDKRYLVRLADAGVPVVPTSVVEVGDAPVLPEAPEIVVKPTVSAGARDTERYGPERRADALAHVRALHQAGRAALVQPYVGAVDEEGETGLVFVGDELSHAFRKGPILRPEAAFVDGLYREESITPRVATDDQRAVAEAVLDAVEVVAPGWSRRDLLYARVDLVPGPSGPLLMELELVEPSLFLDTDPAAAARVAAAIADRLPR
jgi:hypothetical protein